MSWSKESVLEFIELLEGEPCIWNAKSTNHKNRNLVNDAWSRINNKLSVPYTVEELKKKRNTLLTQYRDCLKKIKESTRTGSGAEEIYKLSWFAFDAMHNYLGPLYDHHPNISTEIQDSADEWPISHESNSVESNVERPLSPESYIEIPVSRASNSRSGSDSFPITKRQHGMQDLVIAKKNRCKRIENGGKESNECDLYGQLLAQKLKTLDVDDRLVLMNEIDNIVFKYIMNARKRTKHLP